MFVPWKMNKHTRTTGRLWTQGKRFFGALFLFFAVVELLLSDCYILRRSEWGHVLCRADYKSQESTSRW
jgi:hypothetical protein